MDGASWRPIRHRSVEVALVGERPACDGARLGQRTVGEAIAGDAADVQGSGVAETREGMLDLGQAAAQALLGAGPGGAHL